MRRNAASVVTLAFVASSFIVILKIGFCRRSLQSVGDIADAHRGNRARVGSVSQINATVVLHDIAVGTRRSSDAELLLEAGIEVDKAVQSGRCRSQYEALSIGDRLYTPVVSEL
jgi:hypothetical protein